MAGDINEIVNKVTKFILPMTKEKNIDTGVELDPNLPHAAVDRDLFYRALLNILINAIQSMDKGGRLEVSTRRSDDGWVVIDIADSGIGMSKETVDQIFKPFYTNKHKGTGLGLAITKNIIDGHNGEIIVTSEPHVGTTFSIAIPAV